jgi:predicted nucleic acid-binding protein
VIAYFDTSALIKLVIAEAGAEQARLLWEQASEIVVSRLAWPEALAALAAARRGQRLTDATYAAAVGVFRSCFARCTVVSVADHLVERAAELAAGYDLRAADAIHLATALAALEADSVFITWDKRLQQAALQAGLVTAPAGS